MIHRLAATILVLASTSVCFAQSDTLRIATFNTDLAREGPGLLLRDIRRAEDAQIAAVFDVLIRTRPDIVALQGLDYDHGLDTLTAFADALAQRGLSYPHLFALPTNRGVHTGLDLDGDGRIGRAADAQGFGRFYGQGAMALLSRFPVVTDEVQDYTGLPWSDLPEANLPTYPDGAPFPSQEAWEAQRLSASGHWVVPIAPSPDTRLALLVFHASPPVFDGPEDRNGRRNADEILFWRHFLNGDLGTRPPETFVIVGSANLDPFDGEGRHTAIHKVLNDPRVQDTAPASVGAEQSGDQGHRGDSRLDTVDWPEVGRLRVDYVLPARTLQVVDAGVFWPARGEPGHDAAVTASRHRLVWVDLRWPG